MTELVVAIIAGVAVILAAVLPIMLQQILKELKPNGGSSLRDELNRLANKVHEEAERNSTFRTEMRESVATARTQAETALRVVFETEVLSRLPAKQE